MQFMLRDVLPNGDFVSTAHGESHPEMHVTDDDKQQFYVIGLVRRPCDFLVSWYFQQMRAAEHKLTHESFKDFATHVVDINKTALMRSLL